MVTACSVPDNFHSQAVNEKIFVGSITLILFKSYIIYHSIFQVKKTAFSGF